MTTSSLRAFCTLCGLLVISAQAMHAQTEHDALRSQATLELRALSPAPGSVVSKKTTIGAELNYTIGDFTPNSFFIIVMFETNTPDKTTSANGTFRAPEWRLKRASGTVTVRQKLAWVWDIQELARPLRVWFYVNQHQTGGRSVNIAKYGPIEYVDH